MLLVLFFQYDLIYENVSWEPRAGTYTHTQTEGNKACYNLDRNNDDIAVEIRAASANM